MLFILLDSVCCSAQNRCARTWHRRQAFNCGDHSPAISWHAVIKQPNEYFTGLPLKRMPKQEHFVCCASFYKEFPAHNARTLRSLYIFLQRVSIRQCTSSFIVSLCRASKLSDHPRCIPDTFCKACAHCYVFATAQSDEFH